MKKVLIVFFILIGAAMLIVLPGIGVKNSAISQEEQIVELKASITVQVKTRNEKLTMLIDSIKSYKTYEQAIVNAINSAESKIASGDYDAAQVLITDLVRLYPELKAAEHYETYNTELILCENKIASYQESYNNHVREYKTFVRKFPNSIYINAFGYEVVDFDLINYTNAENDPLPSFGD